MWTNWVDTLVLLISPRFVQDDLNAELAGLEQEVLDERLTGADSVPVTSPVSKVAPSGSPLFVKPKHQFLYPP